MFLNYNIRCYSRAIATGTALVRKNILAYSISIFISEMSAEPKGARHASEQLHSQTNAAHHQVPPAGRQGESMSIDLDYLPSNHIRHRLRQGLDNTAKGLRCVLV